MQKKISLKEKIAFGLGAMNDLIMNNILGTLINPIYNIALHVGPDLLGYAMSIPRIWDAISDPLIASWSDNFRSRWGRRKPFMVIGALISAISLVLIWFVPTSWSEHAMFIYLVAISLVFYTGNTMVLVPYNGLGYALSDDYNERTNLFFFKAIVGAIGGFGLPWIYWLVTRSCFENTIHGVRVVGFALGACILIFTMIPVLFCRENYSMEVQKQGKVSLVAGFRESFANRPFILVVSAITVMFLGLFSASAIGFYMSVFYISNGNEAESATYGGLGGTLWKLCSMVILPIIPFLSKKFDKKPLFICGILLLIIGGIMNFFCVNPAYPILQIMPSIFLGPGISIALLIADSMMGDICDMDELSYGARREAMFGAIYGWFIKVGITCSLAIAGVILVKTGFNSALPSQNPTTFLAMRILNSLLPVSGGLLALCLICYYPLNKKIAYEIKSKLDSNHDSPKD